MSEQDLKSLVIAKLQDGQLHNISDLVRQIASASDTYIYESELRATILGLIRRNRVDLMDDFTVRISAQSAL